MKDSVVVAAIGNRNSGKSHTWNTRFGRTVRTGNHIRRLNLTASEYVNVFLVSGSPEERRTYVGDIIGEWLPRIILCSMQYKEDVTETIDYFLDNDYAIYSQWLNPGYSDGAKQSDSLDLIPYLLDCSAIVSVRDGQIDPKRRVQELRDFIYGWASNRRLLKRAMARA